MKQQRHRGPTRTNDFAAKRLYHLTHCNMRLRHRYGFEMEASEYDEMCSAFAAGRVVGARDDGIGHIEGWVKLRDQWVCARYKKSDRLVGTIMPAPPPLILNEVSEQAAKRAEKDPAPIHIDPVEQDRLDNQALSDSAKKIAADLLKDAMAAGHMPKWLKPLVPELARKPSEPSVPPASKPPPPVSPEVKMQDVRWLKGKFAEACKLMREGQILEAMLLVDSVGSLHRTFHPGKDVETTEREIQKRIDANRSYYENLLTSMGCAHRFEVPPKEKVA